MSQHQSGSTAQLPLFQTSADVYVVQTCEIQEAFNRCLHMACLPTKHGIGKSQKLEGDLAIRTTPYPGTKLPSSQLPNCQLPSCQLQACPCWPHCATQLLPASSMSIKTICTSADGLEVQSRQDARIAIFLTHKNYYSSRLSKSDRLSMQ